LRSPAQPQGFGVSRLSVVRISRESQSLPRFFADKPIKFPFKMADEMKRLMKERMAQAKAKTQQNLTMVSRP
jgi:hypothetical protein